MTRQRGQWRWEPGAGWRVAALVLAVHGLLWTSGFSPASTAQGGRGNRDPWAPTERVPREQVPGVVTCSASEVNVNPALKQKVRSREQARAQVVAGLQALSTARDLVATGGDRETMFEAAARLCDSYVLLRFAQQELFVPQDPQAKKFAERKGIPTDNVVHEHLRKSLDHIRKARSWVTQVAERNNASLLGPISEEVASALVLGRQALQRL